MHPAVWGLAAGLAIHALTSSDEEAESAGQESGGGSGEGDPGGTREPSSPAVKTPEPGPPTEEDGQADRRAVEAGREARERWEAEVARTTGGDEPEETQTPEPESETDGTPEPDEAPEEGDQEDPQEPEEVEPATDPEGSDEEPDGGDTTEAGE